MNQQRIRKTKFETGELSEVKAAYSKTLFVIQFVIHPEGGGSVLVGDKYTAPMLACANGREDFPTRLRYIADVLEKVGKNV